MYKKVQEYEKVKNKTLRTKSLVLVSQKMRKIDFFHYY